MVLPDARQQEVLGRAQVRDALKDYLTTVRNAELESMARAADPMLMKLMQGRAHMLADLLKVFTADRKPGGST